MMRLIISIFLIGFLTSCTLPEHYRDIEILHRERSDFILTLSTVPARPHVGKNLFRATLTDPAGRPITDAAVTFSYRMSHMLLMHNVEKARMSQPGIYEAETDFNMGGDWDVTVEIERPGRKIVREEFVISAGTM